MSQNLRLQCGVSSITKRRRLNSINWLHLEKKTSLNVATCLSSKLSKYFRGSTNCGTAIQNIQAPKFSLRQDCKKSSLGTNKTRINTNDFTALGPERQNTFFKKA